MVSWYMLIRRPLSYLQTLLGVGIFSYRLERRDRFLLRLLISAILSCGACFLSAHYCYAPTVESFVDSLLRLSTQLVQYAAVFFTVWFCHKVTLWSALTLTSAGYCAQQIAGSVKTLVKLLPAMDALSYTPWVLAMDLICYGGAYYLLLLMIQLGVMERGRLSRNVETMQELVHEQHEQFRHSKQSVELVNEKYHDLKGLLEGFHGEISTDQIESLKERIGEYESHIQTGNHVLDIVLSEKRAVCAARKIDFTSYADGHGLDFMEELDLYALVGNSLNNAIDAASKLPEGERFLSLTLHARDGMVSLHVENPYAGELVMGESLPESQRDRRYHGFGMKSMERICEKYGGTLAVRAENGLFTLDAVLFQA